MIDVRGLSKALKTGAVGTILRGMRTLRKPVSLLCALAATSVAMIAMGQPGDPPVEAPPAEAAPPAEGTPPEGTETAPPTEAQPPDAPPPETVAPPEPPPPPKPTNEMNCADGLDEDGDSAVDCADTDCQANAACKPPEPPAPVAAPEPPVEADKGTDDAPPPQMTLGLEGLAGVSGRVGSISSGYDASKRAGLQYGAGLLFAPNRQFAFGLSYIYSGLGSEEFDPSVDDTSGKINRRLHNVAALLRAYPLRSDSIGLWAGLNLGLTWQTASSSGAVETSSMSMPARPYQADVGPQAGLALGASVGMDLDLDNQFAMLTSINFTNHRLSSDPLEGDAEDPTIPGIGSVSQFDLRLALQYRFDVSGASSPVSASVETASK